MLTLLSPSKNLDFNNKALTRKRSEPLFLEQANDLISSLRKMSASDVSELMHINDDLGELNAERYQTWSKDFRNAKPALSAFRGSVYLGLDAASFDARDFTSAQRRVRILSGLYGLLRPLDLIHPYRLEMGSDFRVPDDRSLQEYWRERVTEQLNAELAEHRNQIIVNAASNEYFKAIDKDKLQYPVINCQFLDKFRGNYRFMSFYGKRARGLFAKHVIKNRIETRKALQEFCDEGYRFSRTRSDRWNFVFVRDERPEN